MTTTEVEPSYQRQDRYDRVAMILHWLIALAIILNIALGLYMGDLPRADPMKFAIVSLHKSIGLTVLVLSLARLGWRLVNPFLPLPADMPPLLKLVARGTHVLFYVLIVGTPLAGWLMSSAGTSPISWFGIFNWPKFWFYDGMDRAARHNLGETFSSVHVTLAWILGGLIVLHVAGALYHQFVRRDRIMGRMVPGM